MALKSINPPTLVDLFCGAGGLSDGLAQAGFRPLLGIDFDPHAAATYAANHPKATVLCRDIASVRAEDVINATDGRQIDLVAGGPSCQGYSTHGKREEHDPRNFLFKHFVRIVGKIRPKFVLMENVQGLLAYRRGHFRELIRREFASVGYRTDARVLCAADYGVPQLRRRVFFLGTRLEVGLKFPEPTHADQLPETLPLGLLPYVTVEQAIGDLPLLRGDLDREVWSYARPPQSDFQQYARTGADLQHVTLHQANGISDAASQVVKHIREGHGIRSLPPDLLPERFKRMRTIKDGSLRHDCTTLYYRLHRARPAYTITCFFRNVASGPFIHPCEDRSLSYREAARLMSFRDSYTFLAPKLAAQIGNAVPPLLARALGIHILSLLKRAQGAQMRELATTAVH